MLRRDGNGRTDADGVQVMDGQVSTLIRTRSRVKLLGVATGAGARDPGCRKGPAQVREDGLADRLAARGHDVAWHGADIGAASLRIGRDEVLQVSGTLASLVHDSARGGDRPVVVGGDHSCAIGTWSGMARAIRPEGPMGLIWVDAHMDSHVPETSPSGAYHGMPLAVLMGYGDPELTGLAGGPPAVDPRNVCLVGVRSYEAEEAALLERLGVAVIFVDEVRRIGLDRALDRAVAIATAGTAGFGLSIDIDAIDPLEAPGVGSPVPGGIAGDGLVSAIAASSRLRAFRALEVVEFNPERDVGGKTGALVSDLTMTAFEQGESG